MRPRFLAFPIYPLLLLLFFVGHGWADNLFVIGAGEVGLLLLQYTGAAVLLFGVFRIAFKTTGKAALATFVTLSFYFFFGAFHDFLARWAPPFFSQYMVLLPALFLLYIISLWQIGRAGPGKRITLYLNTLLLLLLLVDAAQMAGQLLRDKDNRFSIAVKPGTLKPNVYFVLLDEYAGAEQLQQTFRFDNRPFLDSLSRLHFAVTPNSASNYHDTPFAMASLLSMTYNDGLANFAYTDKNLDYCYRKIYRSEVVAGFRSAGYRFVNCSIFDFENAASPIDKTFLKSGTQLITAQTLGSRLQKDLYYNFILQHMEGSSVYRNYLLQDLRNNEKLLTKTLQEAQSHTTPVFVYTHLLLPHFPYYFNAEGKPNPPAQWHPRNIGNKALYLAYLRYVNGKVLTTLQAIMARDKDAVILLHSDHGFRYAGDGQLRYANLSAVYFPPSLAGNAALPRTSVNVFRQLFNVLFGTALPMLPDRQFN